MFKNGPLDKARVGATCYMFPLQNFTKETNRIIGGLEINS